MSTISQTRDLARIADALERLANVFEPGPSADCSTVVDQLCNIADHLQAIVVYLEEKRANEGWPR